MKKFCIFIIIIIPIFYGCSNNTLNTSDLKQSTTTVNKGNINVLVKHEIIKSSKENITVLIENNSNDVYTYGVDFKLELQSDNSWFEVPFKDDVAFIEIAVILKPNSINEEVVELSNYFKDLPDGEYRIVKTFHTDGKEIVVAPSFEIKS